jgi:hypothetical protein
MSYVHCSFHTYVQTAVDSSFLQSVSITRITSRSAQTLVLHSVTLLVLLQH